MVVDESAIDGVTVHLSHDDNNINNNHDDDFFPFPLYLSVPREYYNHGGSYNDNSDGKESRREIFKIEGDVPSSPVPVPVRFRRKDLPFDPRGYQGLVSRNRSTGVFDLVDIDECPCACSGTTININTTDSDTPAYNYFPSTDTTYKCPERTVVKLPSFDTLQFPDGRQVTVANNPCSSSSLSKSAAGFITRPIKGGFVACAGRYPVETLMETKIMATTMTTTTTTKTTTTSTTADTTTTTTTDPVVSRVFDKKCTKYRGILDRCLGCIVDGCVASDSGIRYIPTYPNNRPDSLFTKDFIVSVMMAEINKSYMYQKLKTTKDILEQFG
jgi:hypothetical protein